MIEMNQPGTDLDTRRIARGKYFGGEVRSLWIVLIASLALLSGCGGSSHSSASPGPGSLSGNWQFTMAAPSDNSFLGGMQGGFFLQNKGAVTGAVTYSIQLPGQSGGLATICNSGSAPVTGTVNGSSVMLTAIAGNQTFSLTGSLSSDGSTMTGTYNSSDGNGCGTAQTGLPWSAASVPSLTGTIQGVFHSSSPLLRDQDFPVTGTLTQGPNIGASNATVTGSLSLPTYPCLAGASVNGQVSGTSVILQIIASNGLNVGQIGAPAGFSNPFPVTLAKTAGGSVLQGTDGYGVTTKSCPGGTLAGDIGNVCLAIGNSNTCTQPILLTPSSLIFPSQQVGSAPTSQAITLTNTSGATLSGLTIVFNPQAGATSLFGASDFNGLPNFTSQDTCANPAGSTFSLTAQQSCTITISFSPQQSCPWLPAVSLGGEPPALCPFPLAASLTINSPASADSDKAFAVPVSGLGFSAIVPATPELDFGAEAVGEISTPQALTFTNQGANPVQILPPLNAPCTSQGVQTLPRPLTPGSVSGLQVVTGVITPNVPTINYICDSDLTSMLPNFQISADTCSGTLLAPLATCTLTVTYAPQPSTPQVPALDYFLELNTLQCAGATTSNCEIDAGRFPVELTANVPSPLRMIPSASLDFGLQKKGVRSAPMTITLFNDPADPNAGTVNFTGNLVKGDYEESDTCGASLAPGNSCTLAVTFAPRTIGPDPGTLTITYNAGQIQIVHLRGAGQ